MIVDCHTHIFPPDFIDHRSAIATQEPWFSQLYGDGLARMATAEQLVEEMDNSGVDASVACAFGWRDQALCRRHNDYLLQAAQQYRGRILPFANVNPLAGEPAIREMARCLAAGARGWGEVMPNAQQFSLADSRLLAPLAELLVEAKAHLLTHSSEPVGHRYPGKGDVLPGDILQLASSFPALSVICGHWGGGLPFYELMPEVQKALTRVHYDTAAGLFLYRDEVFDCTFAVIGAEKVLFGSDFPLIGQRRFLNRIRNAVREPEALAKVLGENAARLFQLDD